MIQKDKFPSPIGVIFFLMVIDDFGVKNQYVIGFRLLSELYSFLSKLVLEF